MTPREKERLEYAWILSEIKKQNEGLHDLTRAHFEFHQPDDRVPSYTGQEVLLSLLEKLDAIKCGKLYGRVSLEPVPGKQTRSGPTTDEYVLMEVPREIRVEILQPRFNEVCDLYNVTAYQEGMVQKEKIYVSKEKGLYIDEVRRYPIRGKRFNLVLRLFEHGTTTLAKLAKLIKKNKADVSRDIKDINRIAIKSFELDKNSELIRNNKTGEGYFLNDELFKFVKIQ